MEDILLSSWETARLLPLSELQREQELNFAFSHLTKLVLTEPNTFLFKSIPDTLGIH